MKNLLFFSHNQKKIIEINQIFRSSTIRIQNLNSFKDVQDPKESGNTFSENAKIKSKFGLEKFEIPCFGDDSGFCIEALNNKPGIKSKRFLNKFKSNSEAFKYIISKVKKKNNNKAYFITAISLSLSKGHHIIFIGRVDGIISLFPRGQNGFGYDPIFIPDKFNKTFAEMSIGEKNKISHRKKASNKMRGFLF